VSKDLKAKVSKVPDLEIDQIIHVDELPFNLRVKGIEYSPIRGSNKDYQIRLGIYHGERL